MSNLDVVTHKTPRLCGEAIALARKLYTYLHELKSPPECESQVLTNNKLPYSATVVFLAIYKTEVNLSEKTPEGYTRARIAYGPKGKNVSVSQIEYFDLRLARCGTWIITRDNTVGDKGDDYQIIAGEGRKREVFKF